MPNLQYGYDRSSMHACLQGELQRCSSLSLAFNVQHFVKQDFDDQLVALDIRDIDQQDYDVLSHIQDDTAMTTLVDQVGPPFWSL